MPNVDDGSLVTEYARCGTCRWMRDGFCCCWASRRQGHPVCDLQDACPVWMPREDADHADA
jgi:hypothetical protein